MDRNCSICKITIDENNYSKHRTICEKCHNENRRKNKNTLPPNIENVNNDVSTYETRANVVIGPRNVGKTYYMLKVLEKIGNKRPIKIITRSPNQYPNYKTSNEIKPINKYRGSVVIFGDMLGAKNSSQIDEFITRGRHEDLDVYYISQSFFWFTKTKH